MSFGDFYYIRILRYGNMGVPRAVTKINGRLSSDWSGLCRTLRNLRV